MELYRRVEQLLIQLRPAFSRQATFEWFVLLMWGILLASQPPAVSSYLNAIGLTQGYYYQALHFFHSRAWTVEGLCHDWGQLVSQHPAVHQLRGHLVYVGDGIKVAKEGNKMPGVKRLHQESEDVCKAEWIRGHYFGALGLLLKAGSALFTVPVRLELQDGLKEHSETNDPQNKTLVDKMADLCVQFMPPGSFVLLDAYFASAKVLAPFRAHQLHLISRARISTVANAQFSQLPGQRGPGRPRKWGSPIHLRDLFAQTDAFSDGIFQLYGRWVKVNYWSIQLYWDSPDALVQFVLTQLPSGKQIILMTSNVTLSAQEVIEAYGWRFKIEVCFRTLVNLLGGFCYRFWLKTMVKATRWPKDLQMAQCSDELRQQVVRKVEAFERFVNLHAIALGILQILSLEMADAIWQQFPRWFRTLPKHGYPTEQVVRLTLQHQKDSILSRSKPALLLQQYLMDKSVPSQNPYSERLAS